MRWLALALAVAGCTAADAERRCMEAQAAYEALEAPTVAQTGLAITACVR